MPNYLSKHLLFSSILSNVFPKRNIIIVDDCNREFGKPIFLSCETIVSRLKLKVCSLRRSMDIAFTLHCLMHILTSHFHPNKCRTLTQSVEAQKVSMGKFMPKTSQIEINKKSIFEFRFQFRPKFSVINNISVLILFH